MIIINDTNIWIDLKYTNLLDEVFQLPYEIAIPNILFNDELKEKDGDLLEERGVKILEMTDEEVMDTVVLSRDTNKVSFNDLTTLVVARKRNYVLVTGDGNLRKMASSYNIELRGTLWLLDELVKYEIISFETAIEACEKLLASTRRLPKIELQKRIVSWKQILL
nr:MAG TPA: hypothetical protein [Caudoviricetes sp.]